MGSDLTESIELLQTVSQLLSKKELRSLDSDYFLSFSLIFLHFKRSFLIEKVLIESLHFICRSLSRRDMTSLVKLRARR